VRKSSGGVFNNAAQVWNHTFFWNSMKPGAAVSPRRTGGGDRRQVGLVRRLQGGVRQERRRQLRLGLDLAGEEADGSVDIVNTSNAGTPLTTADKALLTSTCGSTPTTSTTATRGRSSSRPS
jgi:superoxide dismutase, Fe-Mn family